MAIQVLRHCRQCYDELYKLRQVSPIPIPNCLDSMEQETAGGIIKKLKAVIESSYFESLPASKIISTGGNASFQWFKSDAKAKANEIWNECKDDLW